jgi:nicotinamide-nucleotide amidase
MAVMWPDAADIIALATKARVTLATAESLTGGLVCAALVSVPGASAAVRGGIVAYDTEVKISTLGVNPLLIEREGPVAEAVALAMARGAQEVLGADVVVATTGVAGPEPHGGHEAGTVVIAVVGAGVPRVRTLHLDGNRDAVTRAAVGHALAELAHALLGLVPREEFPGLGTGLG